MHFNGFYRPATAAEAVHLAREIGAEAMYIAGGTDVLVAARENDSYRTRTLIDLSAVEELKQIAEQPDCIHLGALVTHAAIAASPVIQKYAGVLAAACGEVGSPQIRNRGTIGGNIANASPAADSYGPLAMLNARVTLLDGQGLRVVPLQEAVAGAGRSGLRQGELLCEVWIDKLGPEYRQRFYKIGRRAALSISRLTASVAARMDPAGKIADLRMALGAAFPRPMVFPEINSMAVDQVPSAQLINRLVEALMGKLPEIAGVRPSTEYKQTAGTAVLQRLLCDVFEVNDNE